MTEIVLLMKEYTGLHIEYCYDERKFLIIKEYYDDGYRHNM
jgi:hypothetical protein